MSAKSTDGLILKLSITITHCYNKNGRFLNGKQRKGNYTNSADNHNHRDVDSSRSSSNSSNPK